MDDIDKMADEIIIKLAEAGVSSENIVVTSIPVDYGNSTIVQQEELKLEIEPIGSISNLIQLKPDGSNTGSISNWKPTS